MRNKKRTKAGEIYTHLSIYRYIDAYTFFFFSNGNMPVPHNKKSKPHKTPLTPSIIIIVKA